MKCLVTGAAGFIGSHISERLVKEGYQVVGIDSFLDYYPRETKEKNLEKLRKDPSFTFIEDDLLRIDLKDLLKNISYVFHQAAQAGVRASWGDDFSIYTRSNILATQKLLEACKELPVKKFIYASSSSVYGDSDDLPLKEESLPKPVSPYGVTKLAAEHLCCLYGKNFSIPTVSLRYFTVYGPRQRPDMAFNRFFRAILQHKPLAIYGDGEQTRDFTFISDAVEANLLAMKAEGTGEVFNIGGGSRVTVNRVLAIIQKITGKTADIDYQEVQKGDVKHTLADTSKAQKILGYSPRVRLEEGLEREYEWIDEKF